jgi:murein DD-endopeptidase MepM/ murein hydrolase activator NlpD
MSRSSRALRRLLTPVALAGAAALPASAGAVVADADPAPAAASPSPATAPARPVVDAVTCRTACAGLARAVRGSHVRITGSGLGDVRRVVFLGRRGRRDDVSTGAVPVSPTGAELTIPGRASTGRVAAITASGARSPRSGSSLEIVQAATGATGPVVQARADVARLRPDAGRTPSVSFYVGGAAPADVDVDVLRASDRARVWHTVVPGVAPGTVGSVAWPGGAAEPEGRYVFRVSAGGSSAAGAARAAASATPAPARAPFWLVRSVFPVAGPHRYGEGFGASRSGHGHEGQDVFATCGTPLLAAHDGKVRFVGFQAAAGNYLVIEPVGGGPDIAYMHLRDAPLVRAGAPVARGQRVGFVGDTGDAVGCHLHFELWTAPGWYRGGHAVDPLPTLRAWDG